IYVEDMDLNEGREFFSTACVLGGFDNRKNGVLCSGTPDQIKEETKRLIQTAGKRGTILGADCTLPNDIDLERVRCVVDAAKNV
ncbi:MAG: uroporphyrinogen decarboxylase family protein, partial [Candidatus Ornithomonoglobus sp.]